jgi:hypothetical protein
VTRTLALAFDLGPLGLRLQPAALGTSRWLGGPPPTLHLQRAAQLASQPFFGERAVPDLRSLIVSDDSHCFAELADHAITLGLGEGGRCRDVEGQLDARRCLVRVLAAWATRGAERCDKFVARDANSVGHYQSIIALGTHASSVASVTVLAPD